MKNEIKVEFTIENLKEWVDKSSMAVFLFLSLWILRLIIFIPGITLTILGGLVFLPVQAFFLSLVGLTLSGTLVFLVGKKRLFKKKRDRLKEKHLDIINLIETYNYKFLALGVICPIAPTDVICYMSSYLGLPYRKYIITFIIANIPAVILYSLIGESFNSSIYNVIFIIITLIIIAIVSLKLWNDMKIAINNKEN